MGDWFPIETAPKDGTWVMGFFGEDIIAQMKWGNVEGAHCYHWCVFGKWTSIDPSHWQPIPAPPTN